MALERKALGLLFCGAQMLKRITGLLVCFLPVFAAAQNGAIQGHSYLGGTKAVTSGLSSVNYMDGIIPSATITVYLTGTTTLATIYSNSTGTPLANPFTSNTSASVDPGGWIFWAAINQGLDVVMSGGIAPNTYSLPVTLTDVYPSSSFSPLPSLNCTGTGSSQVCTFAGTVEAGTVSDGTASLHSGSLTGAVNGTFSGTVQAGTVAAGTVSDGTASLHSGSLTGAVNGTFSGTVEAGTTNIGVSDYTQFAAAVTQLSSTGGSILINGMVTLPSNYVVPTNIKVIVDEGGGLSTSGSSYLQIEGAFQAGLYQVFYGTMNVYFYGGVGVEKVYPQWFGATGNAQFAGYTSTSGNATVTLTGQNFFAAGNTVTLQGGGVSGATYTTTVSSVSEMTATLATAPSTTVTSPMPIYTEDDSASLNAWANSVRGSSQLSNFYDIASQFGASRLYVPKGQYTACTSPVVIYSGVTMESEHGYTNMGGKLIQCNASMPILKINSNNYTPNGTFLNIGNGNNDFSHVIVGNSYPDASYTSVPLVEYLNAGNIHSDDRWDTIMAERSNGPVIQLGFVTQAAGTITSGATSITLSDASTFCLQSSGEGCSTIIIVGAGAGGTNLTANITGGIPPVPVPGYPNGNPATVTITPATSTTVTNPLVYAGNDVYGVHIYGKPELDVGSTNFLLAQGNASGSVFIDGAEIYNAQQGGVVSTSISPINLSLTNSNCYGCGIASSGTSAFNYAVNWQNTASSQVQTNTVVVRGNNFYHETFSGTAFGGGVDVSGALTTDVQDNNFYSPDSSSNYKAVLILNSVSADVSHNLFSWTSNYTNWATGAALEIYSSLQTPLATVTGNQFINASGTALPVAINFDNLAIGSVIKDNLFGGTSGFTTQVGLNASDVNVRNTYNDQMQVQKYGGASPISGTWNTGDLIWNNAPSPSSVAGWICTAPGTPGTWVAIPTLSSSSGQALPTISGTQTAGQLACIKSANPTVLGTCTAVSGATCTTCN